jgi:hypothetical protein
MMNNVSMYRRMWDTLTETQIVDRTSATLGIAHEEVFPMYENHTSISRFPTSETPSYKMIASAIRRMAAQSASKPLGRTSTHSSNRSESHGN